MATKRQKLKDEVDETDGNLDLNLGILASVATSGPKNEQTPSKLAQEENNTLFYDGFEGYFDQHKQRDKISTTPFTRAPKLESLEFVELMQNAPKSLPAIQSTSGEKFKALFNQWTIEAQQGFNLCFYGVGSKRKLVMDFLEHWDPEWPVVVANGYVPATTFKEILNTCVSTLLTEDEVADWLKVPSERLIRLLDYLQTSDKRLVLVIHSLDGQALRDDKTQAFISRLVSSPAITLIASVDHVNAPMLWNEQQTAQLNFVWHNTSTFQLYSAETAYLDILGLGKSRASVGVDGVKYVLSSLTTNAHDLYEQLVKAQYTNMTKTVSDPNTMGTAFYGIVTQDLYQKCVEEFIVSNEMNFKIMLSEFIEHKMAEKGRNKAGAEVTFVPYSLDDLDQIMANF